jgi:hypothetical protein
MAENNQNYLMPPPPPPAQSSSGSASVTATATATAATGCHSCQPTRQQCTNCASASCSGCGWRHGCQGPTNKASGILGAEGQGLHHGQQICQESGQDDVSQWLV